jgi:hypothetical protein
MQKIKESTNTLYRLTERVSKQAVSNKIGAFRVVAPCGLFGADRRFRGAYCLRHQRAKFRRKQLGNYAVRTNTLTI